MGTVFFMSGSDVRVIRVAAVVLTDAAGRVLTVRKRGTDRFMQPGGKPEPGESPAQTALRETFEETGLRLDPADLVLMGEFSAPAANEPGFTVVCDTFRVRLDDDAEDVLARIQPAAEIEEVRWVEQEDLLGNDDLAPLLTEVIAPALLK